MVQVIIGIIRLHDGIIHVRPRNPQPRDPIGFCARYADKSTVTSRLFADCVFGLLNGCNPFFRQRKPAAQRADSAFLLLRFHVLLPADAVPEAAHIRRFRAHLRVPLQHGQDDGEHTADEQQRRQKGERGKRASPLLFIVFIYTPRYKIRTAFFKLSRSYSLFCFSFNS